MAVRDLSIRLAAEGGQQVVQELQQVGARGEAALQRIEGASERASAGMGRFRGAAQQVGFQVADVATQISMGTNAFQALSVQGAQLIGMFGGPWGAAVGAAVAIAGALATTMFDLGKETKGAEDATYDYEKALKATESLVERINGLEKTRTQQLREEREAILKAAEAEIAKGKAAVEAQRAILAASQLADPETAFGVGNVAALRIEALNRELEEANRRLDELRGKFAGTEGKLLEEESKPARERARRDEERQEKDRLRFIEDIEKAITRAQEEETRKREKLVDQVYDALERRAEQAAKAEERAREKAVAEAERAAERVAKAAERQIEVVSDRIVDFAADSLYGALKGESADFWESFKDFGLRAFAQLAAEAARNAIILPIVTQVVGSMGGGGAPGFGGGGSTAGGGFLDTAVSFGSRIFGGSSFGFGPQTNASIVNWGLENGFTVGQGQALAGGLGMAATAAAGFAGNFLGNRLSGNGANGRYGDIGGTIGGTIGAAVGGPIGAFAGSFLGSTLGGFLGPGPGVGPNANTNVFINAQGRPYVGSSGADNGGDSSITQAQAAQAVAALTALQGIGATFRSPFPGQPDYLGAIVTGNGAPGLPQTAQDFVERMLREGRVEGLNPALVDTALEQGIDAAVQSVQVARSIEDMVLSITDPVAAALKQLDAEHEARLAAVRAAGEDIADAERLYGLQRAAIVEQGRAQELAAVRTAEQQLASAEGRFTSARDTAIGRFDATLGGIGQGRLALNAGAASGLSPGERLGLLRDEFLGLAGRAQGGDLRAADSLVGAGQSLIGLARDNFGGGGQFGEIFRLVNQTLGATSDRLAADRDSLIAEFGARQLETQQSMLTELRELRAETARLRQDLNAAMAKVA